MAAVRVLLEDLEAGDMPAVCAKSGQAASGTVVTVARKPVPRGGLLLILGVVPYFVARAFRTEEVRVDLPVAAALGKRLGRWVYIARTTSLAAVMVMVVGTVATSAAILLGGILVGLVSLAAALTTEIMWVDATLVDDMVLLERVHPAFTRTLALRGDAARAAPTIAVVKLEGKVAVVTGAASGIGRALSQRFAQEGARAVVAVDVDADGAKAVADELGPVAHALTADVGVEADVVHVVERTEELLGPIDLFCSNAGIGGTSGGVEVDNETWQRIWDINLMAHVYAARAVLPSMLARGDGYLLHTASAAGLLTNIGNAPYSVTKHAVVALAEWLAITHGDRGIKVSCLCPQGVRTNMLIAAAADPAGAVVLAQGAIEPEDVAQAVIDGLAAERFLILPHPEVADYVKRKADDHDRWIAGMRRLQARIYVEVMD